MSEEAKRKKQEKRRQFEQYWATDEIMYNVNPAKRTVYCQVHDDELDVIAEGIAYCAPDDQFDTEFGKALALHRALLELYRARLEDTLDMKRIIANELKAELAYYDGQEVKMRRQIALYKKKIGTLRGVNQSAEVAATTGTKTE